MIRSKSEVAVAVILLTLLVFALTCGIAFVLAMVASAGWNAVSP